MILSYINNKAANSKWTIKHTTHLVGQSIHDYCIGHQVQRMDLAHQHIGWYLMELYVLQKCAQYFLDVNVLQWGIRLDLAWGILGAFTYRIVVEILFAPHERCLELGKLVGTQLLPGEYQANHVLWQQCEAAQI